MTVLSKLQAVFGCIALTALVTASMHQPASIYLIVLAIGSLFALLLTSALFVRYVRKPLERLKKQTAAAAGGDLSRRLNHRVADEFFGLAADIDLLIDQAQTKAGEIAEMAATIRNYEQDLERERSFMEEQVAKRSRDLLEKSEIAAKDGLTGLLNRREALERLRQLWNAKQLYSQPLACILLDIDHFKNFNDTYGHAVGDLVLQEVAAVLGTNVRATDTVCRVGGEEFLVLCPQGGLDAAAACAEHLRRAVQDHSYRHENLRLNVAISLGVAGRCEEMAGPEEMLNLADECLYGAKRSGRNRVFLASQLSTMGPEGPRIVGRTMGHFRAGASETAQNAPIKILIADEDTPLRGKWAKALRDGGVEVVEAGDGHAALSAGRESRFDVMILSASLPGLSGLDCVQVLRGDPATRDVPAILAAQDLAGPALASMLEAGVDDHWIKPIAVESLVLRARSLARLYRGKLELIRNNRMHEEHKLGFSKLFAFSRSLSLTPSLDDVLDQTLAVTSELIQAKRVCVMLPDAQHEHLAIARAIGFDGAAAANLKVPIGKALAGRVYQSRRPVVIATAEEAERGGPQHDAAFFSGMPWVCHPLCAQSNTVGVLGVAERKDAKPFEWQELEYISHVSNMAASAIADIISRKSRDNARDAVVEALGSLAEYRDDNTGQHLLRVIQYSLLLAETLRTTDEFKRQIDDAFLSALIRAVPLHDIGKVGIPDRILLKNRKLTREEMTIMKRHVDIGVDTIQSVRSRVPGAEYLKMAQDIAAGHHEWYNGGGYPKGLQGTKIPLAARIVALADVYDALTTERPYKPAFRHADAVQIICQSSAIQFDPAVVDAFRRQEGQFATLAEALSERQTRAVGEPHVNSTEGTVRLTEEEAASTYDLAPLD